MEQMAMEQSKLLTAVFPNLEHKANQLRRDRFLERMRAGGRVLWEAYGSDTFELVRTHSSDTVRGWGAFAVAFVDESGIHERVRLARLFANDEHFAVREWAWLGIRGAIRDHTRDALNELHPWTAEASPRLRRFASEATRPRSVWGVHLPELKEEPWLGQSLLTALAIDDHRYVQTSVGNWLNDVSLTHSEWVGEICRLWQEQHGNAVLSVCRRAMRRSIQEDPEF